MGDIKKREKKRKKHIPLTRAVSIAELQNKKFKTLDFDGEWKATIGQPEMSGSWLIWGGSANGKTRYALQLCKYLTRFGRVAYNSLEEGLSLSMQMAFADVGMMSVKRRLILLDKEPIEELKVRLRRHKSPDIVVIDSWQYTGLNYTEYKQLRDEFRHKLFIIVSHADGKEPSGRVAKSIKYDAFVKVWVDGFRAHVTSRYGVGGHYDVWPERAQEIWG